MPKTVRIYGMAPNLTNTPPPTKGEEVWLSNWHKGYNQRLPRAIHANEGRGEWTRYFNLHSKRHMLHKYPMGYAWYAKQDATRPIYLQEKQNDIRASLKFPKEEIQAYFSEDGKPFRYFTCSVCWFIALAMIEKFERIELWGFEVRATKPAYAWERPCIAYWVDKARKAGIDVWLPPELKPFTPEEIGNPNTYTGPLYGYETT